MKATSRLFTSLNKQRIFIPVQKIERHCNVLAQTENTVVLNSQIHVPKSKNSEAETSPSVMVMLHGVFGNCRNFSALAKRIARQCGIDVHCLDLRNHGESPHTTDHSLSLMSNDVIRYLTNHIAPSSNCVMFGHSMGGQVAFETVFSHPHLFSAAIIEDASPFSVDSNLLPKDSDLNSPFAAIQVLKNIDLSEMQNQSLTSAKKQISQLLSNRVPSAAVQSFLLTNLVQDTQTKHIKWRCNIAALTKYIESFRSAQVLSDFTFEKYKQRISRPIDVPLLCVRGANSNYVRDCDVERMRELFADVSVSTLDAGHWVHSEKPLEFLNEVVTFLQKYQQE
ncbi:sn-1-specific diacylglycerol lipase ABHD11-like [Convolutriloba macropyga]|uniref:sn-1-specific diacylglycerol lipase ABHD11-like n=1 Tax=Convolutriloba macropyga TaxID=536237 RepID=UPI003F52494B